MKLCLCLITALVLLQDISAASPFTANTDTKCEAAQEVTKLNELFEAKRKALNLAAIPPASDAVFLRRACLNAAGRLPEEYEIRQFLKDKDPDKRAKLIKRLLESPEHADLIAMRFADMLRIKSEFPINLWPNAVQAFYFQLREDIFKNRSYADMVKEMLTASGSNFRIPYSNYFRTTGDRTPAGLASITALNFMGVRLANLPQDEQKGFVEFFAGIRYKKTMEWKEELVYTDPEPVKLHAYLPGTGSFTIHSPEEEPRQVLADALVTKENRYFARAFVNRAWSWFFGKGLIDPADDIVPEPDKWQRFKLNHGWASYPERDILPEVLEYLTDEFKKSNFNMRKLFSIIMNSGVYQATSVIPKEQCELTSKYFLSYPVRRMEAELISDAIAKLTGNYGQYSSVIPEPFTYLPHGTKAVQVSDGSISSSTLELFGRPSRDTGKISERNNQITSAQRLFLMNSGVVYGNLNRRGTQIARSCKWNLRKNGIEKMYLTVLSRKPTPKEIKTILAYHDALPKKERWRVWPDLIWALVNTKEFLYYH